MISFGCVETLGAAYEYKYLGGDNFVYKIDRTISIKGSLENVSGFSGVWSEVAELKPCDEYEEILINSHNLGSGRITNVSFEGDVDVLNKDFTATIEVIHPGDFVKNVGLFSDFDLSSVDANFIKSMNETFNYVQSTKSHYSFERNLSLELMSGFNTQTPRQAAEIIASGTGQGICATRRTSGNHRGCPVHFLHQPPSQEAAGRRKVPRGPLLPPERRDRPASPVAGAQRGYLGD